MRTWRQRAAATGALATGALLIAAATASVGAGTASADPAAPDLATVLKAHEAVWDATGTVPAARVAAARSAAVLGEQGAYLGLGGKTVAVGADFTCAIALLANVWCWGANDEGQLGVGTTVDSTRPVRASAVGGLRDTIQFGIDAGRSHVCALTLGADDTGLYCWGANDQGQLGDGSTTARRRPVEVAAGAYAVATGQEHTCVITADQTVSCWGRNDVGQLGIGTIGGSESSPQPVPDLSDIVDIAAHDNNTCAIDEEGQAWCWGSDTHGQLGNGGGNSGTPQASPVAVTMSGVTGGFTQVDMGSRHVCARTDAGAVYCWGSDSAGQLGDGSAAADPSVPVLVAAGGRRLLSVSAGGDTSCAVSTVGAAYCWGSNAAGQLGTGDHVDHATPVAVDQRTIRASPLTEVLFGAATPMVVDLSVGESHTCAVDVGFTVYCWGANDAGQLGNGTTDDAAVPTVTVLGPGPATGVHATARDRAVRVGWSAPADSGAGAVSAYVAIAIPGAGADAAEDAQDCGAVQARSCTIEPLINDRRYRVLVLAVTLGGLSSTAGIYATPAADGSVGALPITGPDATGSLAVAAILLSTGLLCRVLARPRRGPAA